MITRLQLVWQTEHRRHPLRTPLSRTAASTCAVISYVPLPRVWTVNPVECAFMGWL
ncbi:MAG: hypothetical protein U1F87_03185 [Kiritimatiellia bacterium]